MIWPTGWMVRTFVRDHENVTDQRVRLGYVRLQCWASIFGNVILGTIKLVIGISTASISLTADAIHTYGDMLGSVVLIVSMRVAVSPPDKRHPFGHGRAEALGTLALAGILLIAAVEFAHPAIHRFLMVFWPDPRQEEAIKAMANTGWWIVPVLIAFWAFKEWMARFSADLGKSISSDALAGDAQHHRSDALATLLVIFSYVGVKYGMPWLDGLFGFGVAGFIGWAGGKLAWGMFSQLMGEAPPEDLVSKIVSAAASVHGVRGVHGVEVHDYGNHKVATLHIEVSPHMETGESHKVASLVEESLLRRMDMSSVVHVEVVESGTPAPTGHVKDVEEVLTNLIQTEKSILGYHAVHVTSSDKLLAVNLHLAVTPGLPVEECNRLEHELTEKLRERMGVVDVNVHCEPGMKNKDETKSYKK